MSEVCCSSGSLPVCQMCKSRFLGFFFFWRNERKWSQLKGVATTISQRDGKYVQTEAHLNQNRWPCPPYWSFSLRLFLLCNSFSHLTWFHLSLFLFPFFSVCHCVITIIIILSSLNMQKLSFSLSL